MENFDKHYLALGLRPGATREEIHSAFRRKAQLYHPDKDASLDAEMRYHEVRLAYDLLHKATNTQSSQSQSAGHGRARRTARNDNFTDAHAETKRSHTTSGSGWYAYEADDDISDLQNELKKEKITKRRTRNKFYLAIAALFAFMVFAGPNIVNKVGTWNDLRSMEKFTSTEGMFSMEIPKRWMDISIDRMPYTLTRGMHSHVLSRRLDDLIRLDDRGVTYLKLRHALLAGGGNYSPATLVRFANMNVNMATLPSDHPIPSVQELAAELNANLTARQNINLTPTNTRFEIKRMKGFSWAKTTLTVDDVTFFIWQVVDDMRHQYAVGFATDNTSRYEPVFDIMINSFSFDSR